MSDRFFAEAPVVLAPFLHSGVLLGIVTAIALNLLLRPSKAAAREPSIDNTTLSTASPVHTGG